MKLKLLFWLRNLVLLNILIFTFFFGAFAQTNTITEFPGQPIGSITTADGALWFPAGNSTRTGQIIARISTDGVLTEFPLPVKPLIFGITAGPDGAIWFTDVFSRVGRVTTTGDVTFYPISDEADDIVTGPDGALWFTEIGKNNIGRITTSGALTEYQVPTAIPLDGGLPPSSGPFKIAVGPDGAVWFTEIYANQIGRITTDGFFTEYPIPKALSNSLTGIAAGPDGALWFGELASIFGDAPGRVGRITTGGVLTEFPLPVSSENFNGPTGIALGPDGAMWFTEEATGKIARITTDGNLTEFPLPDPFSQPQGITKGPDGAMWFTEGTARIGRIAVATGLQVPAKVKAGQTQLGCLGNQIELSWEYAGAPIDGFHIQRQTPLGIWEDLLPDPTASDRTFIDTVPPFTYSYHLRAFQGNTNSEYSDQATAFQLVVSSSQCNADPRTRACPPAEVIPLCAGQGGNVIIVDFTPDAVATLAQVAPQFAYDHFNWTSVVNPDAPGSRLHDNAGNLLIAPYLDPPIGGYADTKPPVAADDFPYYWDEVTVTAPPAFEVPLIYSDDAGGDQRSSHTARFSDLPGDPLIKGPGDFIGFLTTLVGVRDKVGANTGVSGPDYSGLVSLSWFTTYNGSFGSSGGVGRRSNIVPPSIEGTGNIFNAQIVPNENLPTAVRQLLIARGIKGIPNTPKIDRDSPMTAAFFSGNHGTNGWFTSLVETNLIATDIDGPADIASTTYSLDEGTEISYTGPFFIAGNGIHNLEFGSADIAGNLEAPRPSRIVKIDSTAPTITPSRTPAPNANGWNNTNVALSFACSDALSGLAAGSPPAPTMLTTEGTNQQITGTCQDLAGNVASATVSGINIDKTPPALSGLPAAGCTLWPPDKKFVTVATISAADVLSGLSELNVTGTSNEPQGPNSPDIIISGTGTQPRTVQLRADRLGTGTGRVYTLTTAATDTAGNTTTAVSTCSVPHDQGK